MKTLPEKRIDEKIELKSRTVSDYITRHPHRQHDVLVFIPARNEEHTIEQVVKKVRTVCDYDILVLDDGSTDRTPEILRNIGVSTLTHEKPRPPTGMIEVMEITLSLGYQYVVKIDGDDQHDAQDAVRLYEHAVKTGADIVIGSRHLQEFKANIFTLHGIGMWFCAKLVYLLSKQRITDTTSGLKIWSRRACELDTQGFMRGKLKQGPTFSIEELILAARKKLKIEEIPVTIRPRLYGESKSFSRKNMLRFPINLVRSIIRGLL